MVEVTDKMSTPPGGWKYTQPESGFTFTAITFSSLVSAVYKHRLANGYDTAEGWQDRFAEQLCRQCGLVGTNWCHETVEGEVVQSKRALSMADLKRFLNSVRKMAAAGGNIFVDQETANARAAICSTCIFNRDIKGCFGCNTISSSVGELLAGRSSESDSRLKSCGVCGCVNRVKVWLKSDVVDNEGLEYPEFCWNARPASSAESAGE